MEDSEIRWGKTVTILKVWEVTQQREPIRLDRCPNQPFALGSVQTYVQRISELLGNTTPLWGMQNPIRFAFVFEFVHRDRRPMQGVKGGPILAPTTHTQGEEPAATSKKRQRHF